jgi:hypothetical protein
MLMQRVKKVHEKAQQIARFDLTKKSKTIFLATFLFYFTNSARV